MPVKVTGEKELIAALEQKFGETAMRRFSQKAQRKGAVHVLKILKKELEAIDGPYRKGHTVKEATLSGPERVNNEWVYKIHWQGSENRFRVIHLNEWGTVRVPNPPLKGAIARTIKNVEKDYYKILQNEFRKELMR